MFVQHIQSAFLIRRVVCRSVYVPAVIVSTLLYRGCSISSKRHRQLPGGWFHCRHVNEDADFPPCLPHLLLTVWPNKSFMLGHNTHQARVRSRSEQYTIKANVLNLLLLHHELYCMAVFLCISEHSTVGVVYLLSNKIHSEVMQHGENDYDNVLNVFLGLMVNFMAL